MLSPGTFVDFANTNQVLLDDLRPSADLTSVTMNALEDETGNPSNWTLTASGLEDVNGNPVNWSVTAYGICAWP